MGLKPTTTSNTFTSGEISPKALGRFDLSKFSNAAEKVENFLISQLGGAFYRPGTRYVANTKTAANRSRLLRFQYSTTQSYAIEAGNLYFRYYADGGRVESGGNPVELVTPFALADLPVIRYAQNNDIQYITTGVYQIQRHTRLTATSFSISSAPLVRGPFLDTNITSITIDPSGDTGVGITLTASSATFLAGHIGSLWRIKDGVAKITAFTNTTNVTATVQSETDGTAGNLGTGGTPTTDWAEGSWSGVRGYPKVCTFHAGRFWVGHTSYQPGGVWGSRLFNYDNFEGGADDDNAVSFELNADEAVAIRWLSSSANGLLAGTTGGTFVVGSGSQGLPITPDNINAPQESFEGSADIQARRMGNYVYFPSNDLQKFLEGGYQFDVDAVDSVDMTLLADHILNAPDPTNIPTRNEHEVGGAYDMDVQQSPNSRVWVVRDDGQIVVLTRNPRQEVMGWSRITGGMTVACDGKSGIGVFESIVILKQEGQSDVIWVQVNRLIGGEVTRFIEYFTPEKFKYEWDPVRVDCSLTLDNPITITNIILLGTNVLIIAPAHGLVNGDQIRLDNVVGTWQLNGNTYLVKNAGTDSFKLDYVT